MSYAMKSGFYKLGMKEKNPIKTLKPLFNSLRAVRRAWIPKGPLLELIFAWLRKGSTFGAHFLTRGSFWSDFWLMFGSFFGYFGSFFVLGRTLGALGANFFITKTVWTTKGAPIGISPKMASLFWSHFGVIFRLFFDFWGSVFELRFLLSSGTDFSWILASFRHNFLIFFSTCRHLWF